MTVKMMAWNCRAFKNLRPLTILRVTVEIRLLKGDVYAMHWT